MLLYILIKCYINVLYREFDLVLYIILLPKNNSDVLYQRVGYFVLYICEMKSSIFIYKEMRQMVRFLLNISLFSPDIA